MVMVVVLGASGVGDGVCGESGSVMMVVVVVGVVVMVMAMRTTRNKLFPPFQRQVT